MGLVTAQMEPLFRDLPTTVPEFGATYDSTNGIVVWDTADPGYLAFLQPFRRKDPLESSEWIRLASFGWAWDSSTPPDLSFCIGTLDQVLPEDVSCLRVRSGLTLAVSLGLATPEGYFVSSER